MVKVYEPAMKLALNAAEQFVGATAPNPPVGCIALDKDGKVLLGAAHQKAGTAHAEAKVLELAEKLGKLSQVHTLVVTLEPCNHRGRTPPCTEAILRHRHIKRVVFGAADPNPQVNGGGAARLREAGLEVVGGVLEAEAAFLIRAFTKWSRERLPWVTVKAAFTPAGSMIPPTGQKTFTSKPSLIFAHGLRKRADALWTGSGTVLADDPEFTVRWLPDHPGKNRWLLLSDRRRQVPQRWLDKAKQNGFFVHQAEDFAEGLAFLGKKEVLEVLVEAGPTLRQAWLESGLWDESVVINQGAGDADDELEVTFRANSQEE